VVQNSSRVCVFRQLEMATPTILQELDCCVCLGLLEDPVVLSCGHTLCKGCADRLALCGSAIAALAAGKVTTALSASAPPAKAAPSPSVAISCPLCRSTTPAESVKPNVTLRAVVAEFRRVLSSGAKLCGFCKASATVACSQCGPLCGEHHMFLHVTGPFRTHAFTAIAPTASDTTTTTTATATVAAGLTAPLLCKEHVKELDLFCAKDDTLVCSHCLLIGSHKGHDCVSLRQAAQKAREDAEALLKQMHTKAAELQSAVAGHERAIADAAKERTAKETELHDRFAALHAELERAERSCLDAIGRIFDPLVEGLREEIASANAIINEVEQAARSIKASLGGPDTSCITAVCYVRKLAADIAALSMSPIAAGRDFASVRFSDRAPNFSEFCTVGKGGGLLLRSGRVVWAKLVGSKSQSTTIQCPEPTTHDGGAVFDAERRAVFAVSGNRNSGRDVVVTRFAGDGSATSTISSGVIPFGTHGACPVFDGKNSVFFFESESGQNNRFGCLNTITLAFEELPSLPSGNFVEFSSGCFQNGHLYVLGAFYVVWRYSPISRSWTNTGWNFGKVAKLLADPTNLDVIWVLDNSGTPTRLDVVSGTRQTFAARPNGFRLGANYEAIILAIDGDGIAICAGHTDSSGWTIFNSTTNTWTAKPEWKRINNSSSHTIFDAACNRLHYHVHDEGVWEQVDLS